MYMSVDLPVGFYAGDFSNIAAKAKAFITGGDESGSSDGGSSGSARQPVKPSYNWRPAGEGRFVGKDRVWGKKRPTFRSQEEPVTPVTPDKELSPRQQWDKFFVDTAKRIDKKWVEFGTPAGVKKNLTTLGRGAVAVGKGVVDAMDYAETKLEKWNARKVAEERALEARKQEWFAHLPHESQEALLNKRAREQYVKAEIQQERDKWNQYSADRTMAALSGQRWQPRVFKVAVGSDQFGLGTEFRYVDEYGREVPEPAGEMFRRGSRRKRKTSESSDIANIFDSPYHFGSGGELTERRYYDEPPARRSRTRSEAREITGLFD
jgi:hypothetical protein